MALADASAPESIIVAVRQSRVGIESCHGKQTGIPSHGDHADVACSLCSRIDCRQVLRNVRVGVKTVDHIELACDLRRHLRQVCSAAPAEDHHVDVFCHLVHLLHRQDFRVRLDLHSIRIPSGEDCHQIHVSCLRYRRFNSSAQVTVSYDSYFHIVYLL